MKKNYSIDLNPLRDDFLREISKLRNEYITGDCQDKLKDDNSTDEEEV